MVARRAAGGKDLNFEEEFKRDLNVTCTRKYAYIYMHHVGGIGGEGAAQNRRQYVSTHTFNGKNFFHSYTLMNMLYRRYIEWY